MNHNLEMEVNTTQAGLYVVTYGRIEAPLDVQEATFAVHGVHTFSLAQLGFLRAQEGKGTFNPYSRTGADVFYDDRYNQVVVVPNGAISGLVGIANIVDAHRQGKDYVIPKNQRDLVYAVADEMLRKGIAVTANHGLTTVNTSEFGQTELTSIMFSDERLGIKAQDYGDWQRGQGRDVQSTFFDNADYAESQKGPYVNRLRVCGPDGVFDVFGKGRDLYVRSGAFGGSFKKTAEGGAKK